MLKICENGIFECFGTKIFVRSQWGSTRVKKAKYKCEFKAVLHRKFSYRHNGISKERSLGGSVNSPAFAALS